VYYPLHVPADFALTIRAPEYLDQCALIDYLCRVVPHTHQVVVKEHPALIGAVPYSRLRDLLERHDNLVLLDPGINNYRVLGKADALVTVNSKSGAEALLLGRPVLVLGDSFYRASALAHRVDALSQLPAALARVLDDSGMPDRAAIEAFFQNVWDSSYPGELYDVSDANVATFSASLIRALSPESAR
jgi:capsule polysaccharide modification protein KpsS